jgi:SAM-dependent methyltransferase
MTSPRGFYDSLDAVRWGREELKDQRAITVKWAERLTIEGPSLELGCGVGALAECCPPQVGIDLSFAALRDGRGASPQAYIQAYMERLPFGDGTFRFVFSWAAIEHVPQPELVFAEIVRILRPGGIAVLAPAWHCRTWAAEGLEFRPYRDLRLGQRIRKALIPLRNSLWWRGAFELPRRLSRELRAKFRVPDLEYDRLKPNLDEFLGTDSDAFTSLDPQAAILYFATRGWEVLSHPTTRARLLARHEPVVVRKPA